MIGNGESDSGNLAWWIDALDPAANLRALPGMGDASRQLGRQLAENLADRLATAVGAPGGGARSGGEARFGDGGLSAGSAGPPRNPELNQLLRRLRAGAAQLGDASAELIEDAAALFGVLIARLTESDVRNANTTLQVGPVAAGKEATALFWVHNTSAAAVAAVRPHCAEPRSHTGATFRAGALRFDPEVLDPLPPRSSCGIEVLVRVPADTPPGSYASVILARNAPDWHLPISITITEPDATDSSG